MSEQSREVSALTAAQGLVQALAPRIQEAVPRQVRADRLLRLCQNAISRDRRLAGCTPRSLCESVMSVAELGLEPNTPRGECYLLVYGGQATLQIGYQGLITLAYRSGRVKSLYAEEVHANDTFEVQLGLRRDLVHVPARGERGPATAYYAVVHLEGAEPLFAVMTRGEVEVHGRKYSKSFGRRDSVWQMDFDAMAKKTVLIRVLKLAPKATDDVLERAVHVDGDRTVGRGQDRADAIDTTADAPPTQVSAGLLDRLADELADSAETTNTTTNGHHAPEHNHHPQERERGENHE